MATLTAQYTSLITTNRFLVGLAKSFGVILASEIGDKTFFIAAVMAMRNPRVTVSPWRITGRRERRRPGF
jgi:hypothetical protein